MPVGKTEEVAVDVAKPMARGIASEARVLADMGLTKNSAAVSTAEGRSIPDALTSTASYEIKDTARVTLTRQLSIQTDAARAAGIKSVLVGGQNAQISGPAHAAFDQIITRPDLGHSNKQIDMASQDLDKLFQSALSFAERMLAKEGEFIPFGVSMDTAGEITLVSGDIGSEHPASKDVIQLLQSSFHDSAREGEIKAAGVCMDVRTVPPGEEKKTDAICVRLAHISGEAAEVFVPYVEQSRHKYLYGDTFASHGDEFVFRRRDSHLTN